MKKTCIIFLLATMILFLLAMPAMATGEVGGESPSTLETTATITETTATIMETTTPGTDGGEANPIFDYFTRLREFWNTYQAQILEIGSGIVMVITSIVVGVKNGKKINEVKTVADTNTQTLAGENGVVSATNGLIDAYNGMTEENKLFFENLTKEYADFSASNAQSYAALTAQMQANYKQMLDGINEDYKKLSEGFEALQAGYAELRKAYEKYGETENDRNRVTGAVLAQSAAVLEILQLVYANSGKLPQGVKDLINLKYANTLKTIGDDKQLLAIVAAVRDNINAGAVYHGEDGNA